MNDDGLWEDFPNRCHAMHFSLLEINSAPILLLSYRSPGFSSLARVHIHHGLVSSAKYQFCVCTSPAQLTRHPIQPANRSKPPQRRIISPHHLLYCHNASLLNLIILFKNCTTNMTELPNQTCSSRIAERPSGRTGVEQRSMMNEHGDYTPGDVGGRGWNKSVVGRWRRGVGVDEGMDFWVRPCKSIYIVFSLCHGACVLVLARTPMSARQPRNGPNDHVTASARLTP